ncbi:MAG: ABC transporter ATP-binding protein [Planctomycetes bacterium]|nr:ABC transporter ATP-binding protein [Planctomycetota bacterium]
MAAGIALSFGVPLVTRAAIDGPLASLPRAPLAPPYATELWPAPAPGLLELALERRTFLQEVGARLGLDAGGQLWLAGALLLALAGASGLCFYLRGRLAALASEGLVRRLRQAVHDHLNHLPTPWLDAADTGDLVQRCTSDVETVRTFLATQVIEIGRAALLVGLVTPVIFHLDFELACVALALLPVLVTSAFLFFRHIKALFQRMDEAEGRMTTVLQENLTAIRVVRAFGRQEHEREKFAAANAEFRDHHVRFIRLLGRFWSSSDVLTMSQLGLVLVVGAWRVREGALSLGTLAAFLEYEALIIWPVRQLGRVLAEAGKAVVSMRRLREVLDVAEESDLEGAATAALPALRGALEVRDLGFGFAGGAAALDGISFRLDPGQTLALIGPPGAGKTTLVQLLLRLYDYERGSIRLDGHELRELPRRFVRRHFGVVLQEPFLYSRSVRANLVLGMPDVTEETLCESTRAAAVHEAILEFPGGYETEIGERGVTLSGGQRQRIALARALLKDPPILVLDDALSAVDTETESRILEALAARRGTRTTIIVAHRLSSVLHADLTLVLERGRIVQAGHHADLIRAEGPYRRLWEIQGALEAEIERDLQTAAEPGGRA